MNGGSVPRSPKPSVAPWRAWHGWATLIIGVYIVVAPLWTSDSPLVWFIPVGAAVGAVALWQLGSALQAASNWTQIVVGAVGFFTPWLGGFSDASVASWTLWILSVAVVIISAIALGNVSRNRG